MVSTYSDYAKAFREALVSQRETGSSKEGAKAYLKTIFKKLDDNGDGIVTDTELRNFVKSIHLLHTTDNNYAIEKNSDVFADVLVQQIDINHDGTISFFELSEFLWPRSESKREMGEVMDIMRQTLTHAIGEKILSRARNPQSDQDIIELIKAFANHTNVALYRTNLIEVRALKRSFRKMNAAGLGNLSPYEIDMLIDSLDANSDGVVSPREFKAWLFLQTFGLKGSNDEEIPTSKPVKASESEASPLLQSGSANQNPPAVMKRKSEGVERKKTFDVESSTGSAWRSDKDSSGFTNNSDTSNVCECNRQQVVIIGLILFVAFTVSILVSSNGRDSVKDS